MTYAELRRLQWAVRRVQFLKDNPSHLDAWKGPIYQYDVIPEILKDNLPYIQKLLEQNIKPPPTEEFKL